MIRKGMTTPYQASYMDADGERYIMPCAYTLIPLDLQFFAEGEGGEKTEEPTAKKLTDARNKGQVANSREVGNAVGLLMLFLMIRIFYSFLGQRFRTIFQHVYGDIPSYIVMYEGVVPIRTLKTILNSALLNVLILSAPFLIP